LVKTFFHINERTGFNTRLILLMMYPRQLPEDALSLTEQLHACDKLVAQMLVLYVYVRLFSYFRWEILEDVGFHPSYHDG